MPIAILISLVSLLVFAVPARAALLAYEPFTNAPGVAIIGSAGGGGFAGAWQANGSAGIATNTTSGLGYTDAVGNRLLTAGGAGFFQGLTTANSSMQPNRVFNSARATNGGAATTWISLLLVRQGPTNGTVNNPFSRGVNVTFDYPDSSTGANQRFGVGNSSGAATNTLGILSAGGNLRPSANPPVPFGGGYGSVPPLTNFVVLRIDHVAGTPLQADDNVYLWANPANLAAEPALATATTNVIGLFDYSIGLVRVFVGGQDTANNRPYGELIVDEIRVGETFTDVAPFTSSELVITNVLVADGSIVLSGQGGPSAGQYHLLGGADLGNSSSNWPVLGTNSFDGNGGFIHTQSLASGATVQFYRLRTVPPAPPVLPVIQSGPLSLSVTQGNAAAFSVTAHGTAPLGYQWFLNTNSALSGQTASNLSLVNVQSTNAGVYSVRVSNAAGSVTSAPALLTVFLPPAIVMHPQSQSVQVSNPVSFTVTASGTAPLRYQWFFNTNTLLLNATNSALNLTNVQFADAGDYSVRVTNTYGSITSAPATLAVTATVPAANYYVATTGSDSNPGTNIAAPFATLAKAASLANPGNLIYVRGGTYNWSAQVGLTRNGTPSQRIRVFAYPGEKPIFDFSNQTSGYGISIGGRCWHLKGLEVANAADTGIHITGSTNIIEQCVMRGNKDTGLQLRDPSATGNLILNCDSYRNYDPANHGENADGFTAKFNLGEGNVFSGCRAWENSDDGWDLWQATGSVTLTNCWAWRNGTNAWNDTAFQGDGNGIKLGGDYFFGPHRVYRCVVFRNPGAGFDQNNNNAGQTLYHNTAWANGKANYNLNHGTNITPHVVCNNLSIAGGSSDSFRSGTLATNNSWQVLSPAASTSDVLSINEALAASPRQADGSLPAVDFLRPVPGGRLVNVGVNVGLPYNGSAPDLGAFEAP